MKILQKNKYQKIWELAKPYYLKGRPMDIAHIEWIMEAAIKLCKEEKIDDAILLPLVILHDVGYAEHPDKNPFNLDIRKAHMAAGAKIAEKILKKLNYPKTEKIVYYVSVHDNWAFGELDMYNNDLILGTFKDLDFIWMATPKGFPAMMNVLDKNHKEMVEYLIAEKGPIGGKKPFSTKTAKKMYEDYLKERETS